jgi:hypothetical protein
MNPHTLASHGLVHYTGDTHPLSYGGAWIDISTWVSDGYASAVRVTVLDDGPDAGRHIVVDKLTINKPADMSCVWSCCGDPSEDPVAQADACMQYGAYDPDCSDWREPSSYSFIIPDDGEAYQDFTRYAEIHNATIVSEEDIDMLLKRLVGCELYNGR